MCLYGRNDWKPRLFPSFDYGFSSYRVGMLNILNYGRLRLCGNFLQKNLVHSRLRVLIFELFYSDVLICYFMVRNVPILFVIRL